MNMDAQYDIAEGWAAVEIEYEGGGRSWTVVRQGSDLDGFINVQTSMGHFLSDVDATTQYCAAEAYTNWLYKNDAVVREAIDAREAESWGCTEPQITLESIVAELKRREVALGLREAE